MLDVEKIAGPDAKREREPVEGIEPRKVATELRLAERSLTHAHVFKVTLSHAALCAELSKPRPELRVKLLEPHRRTMGRVGGSS